MLPVTPAEALPAAAPPIAPTYMRGASSLLRIIVAVSIIVAASFAVYAIGYSVTNKTSPAAGFRIALSNIVGAVTGKPNPTAVLYKYCAALSNKDFNTAMECMEPQVEKAYKAGSRLLEGLLGFSVTDVADLLPLVSALPGGEGVIDSYTLSVKSAEVYSMEGDSAVIDAEILVKTMDYDGNPQKDLQHAMVPVALFDGEWRLTGLLDGSGGGGGGGF